MTESVNPGRGGDRNGPDWGQTVTRWPALNKSAGLRNYLNPVLRFRLRIRMRSGSPRHRRVAHTAVLMAGIKLPCKSLPTVTSVFTLCQSDWIQFVTTRRDLKKSSAFEIVSPMCADVDIALARRMALRLYHYQLNQLLPP